MKTTIALNWLIFILFNLLSDVLLSQSATVKDIDSGQITHKLTKIVNGDYIQEFEYDEEGLIIQELRYDSNRSETRKYTYTDSQNISLIEVVNCHYSEPCITSKIEYDYDLNGNVSQVREYTDQIDPTTVVLYRRDNDGNPTVILNLYTREDTNGNIFESASRQLLAYDSFNRVTKRTRQDLSQTTSSWITNSIYDFNYSEKGTEETYSNLISDLKYKTVNTFKTPEKDLLVKSQYFEETSNQWNLIRLYELELNENSNPIVSYSYEWSEVISELVPSRRSEFIYGDGNIIRRIVSSFSELKQTWEVLYKNEYSFKKGLCLNQLLGANYISGIPFLNIAPTSSKQFVWNGEWIPTSETQYFYQNVGFYQENLSLVYPNPASNNVSFDLMNHNEAYLYIYDAHGANVKEQTIQTSRSISIQELKKGIYYYKIISDGNVQTGKLVKD